MFSLLPKDIVIIIAYEVHRYTMKRIVTEYHTNYTSIYSDSVRYGKPFTFNSFTFNYRNLRGTPYEGSIHNIVHKRCCRSSITHIILPKRYFYSSGNINNLWIIFQY